MKTLLYIQAWLTVLLLDICFLVLTGDTTFSVLVALMVGTPVLYYTFQKIREL